MLRTATEAHLYTMELKVIVLYQPFQNRTKLASLVKGRWIDGKAQTVALLLSVCDMPTLFIFQTFLPSRRRDCTPSAPSMRFSALSLAQHHILASLVKGEVLLPEKIRATTGEIATSSSLAPRQPFQNRQHPCLLLNALLALRPCKAFGRSTSGIHAPL